MLHTVLRSFSSALLALSVSAFSSGCANFERVGEFAQASQKMSVAFDPVLEATVGSCMDNSIRRKMISTDNLDPHITETQARTECQPIADANQNIARLNAVLARYAATLLDLSDSKVSSYKDEFGGLNDALSSIKVPGSDATLLTSSQVSIITKLSEYLSRLLTQKAQASAIDELLGQQEAMQTITNALNTYVQYAYQSRIAIQRRDSGILHEALDATASTEPLATNYVRTRLYHEEQQLSERAKIPRAFTKAVTAFQTTLDTLRSEKYDKSNPRLRQQLREFSRQVDELDRQVAYLAPVK